MNMKVGGNERPCIGVFRMVTYMGIGDHKVEVVAGVVSSCTVYSEIFILTHDNNNNVWCVVLLLF